MIIAVPKIIAARPIEDGEQVILISECTSILEQIYSVAVYDIKGARSGYCAKKFTSTRLHINLLLKGIKSYVWLADKNFILIKLIDEKTILLPHNYQLN